MLRGDDAVRAGAARDVAELDALISELLEASRLEAVGAGERAELLDLLGLVAEEAARTEAASRASPWSCAATRACCDGWCATCSTMRAATPAARRSTARVEASRGARGCAWRTADQGFPESERERIFEPFYRPPGAPETGSGYGLGLALVRQIARAHSGDVACRPRDGGGTEFEVVLMSDGPH